MSYVQTENAFPRQILNIAKALLARGADVNARDVDGNTPITELFIGFAPDDVDFHLCEAPRLLVALLDAHANIEVTGPDGFTPLFLACLVDDTGSVKTLLNRGANPNVHQGDLASPLLTAQNHGHTDIAALLKSHGAKQ